MFNTSSDAFQKLRDISRRRRFIANQIKNGFAFQVRALRKDRNNMTQQELARLADTTQTVISRIEKNGASNFNVKTLRKIAEAFDVALVVRLEPIDRLLGWVDDLSPESMAPRPSSDVLSELERVAAETKIAESARARRALGTTNLRVLDTPDSTAAVQRTLPLNAPRPVQDHENSTGNRHPVEPPSTVAA